MNIKDFMDKIRQCMTPDLLKPQYKTENASNPMFGHCYVASEVLYHNIKNYGNYSACCARDEQEIVHWWIVDNDTSNIYDVTSDQYYNKGLIPPYSKGKKTGFLTKKPSKRAMIVMERLK